MLLNKYEMCYPIQKDGSFVCILSIQTQAAKAFKMVLIQEMCSNEVGLHNKRWAISLYPIHWKAGIKDLKQMQN